MTARHSPDAPLEPEEIVARIKKALKRSGTYTWDDLVKRLREGSAQIFWNEHGAWITELVTYPLGKCLHVWIVAGELPEVMDLQPQVLAYAKAQGCKVVSATARLGWKPVAKAHGWKEKSMLITHEVE